jgi:hypothetical protein
VFIPGETAGFLRLIKYTKTGSTLIILGDVCYLGRGGSLFHQAALGTEQPQGMMTSWFRAESRAGAADVVCATSHFEQGGGS